MMNRIHQWQLEKTRSGKFGGDW